MAMLGIRISLEDVTASSGLLPDGAAPPPAIHITQPDAQIPPPPPKVPSILQMIPPSGSRSPQLSTSPTNTHGSPSDARLPHPSAIQDALGQAHPPSTLSPPHANQALHSLPSNNTPLEWGLDSLGKSEDSPEISTHAASGLGSPILEIDLEIAPRPGLPITPDDSSIAGVQLPTLTPTHEVGPPLPQPSMQPKSDSRGKEAAAGVEMEPPRTSQGASSPDEGTSSQGARSDGASSPVHNLAAVTCPPGPPASPGADDQQGGETASTASASPSVLGTTQSGVQTVLTAVVLLGLPFVAPPCTLP